ncbi:MAG: pyruvate kinase alpha/beta domain-containing protein [Candidatus Thorarchaeota archaeon]
MQTLYLPSSGPQHTETVLERSLQYAQEAEIATIILASTTGATARKMLEYLDRYPDLNLIVVTHHWGFRTQDSWEFDVNIAAEIRQRPNCQMLTTAHALSGVERSFRLEFKTMLPIEMIALTLRRTFGDGTKVAMEMALMVADSGLVDTKTDIVCIAGTGRGADTAWRLRPSTSNRLFDLRMKEIIAKPAEF